MAATLAVTLGSLGIVLIAHYWTLWSLAFVTPADDAGSHGRSMLMLLLLAGAHVLHILAYAGLLAVLIHLGGWDGFTGSVPEPMDVFYFSSTAYATLGVAAELSGPFRLICVFEGLAGFMTLTWSATFVYSAFRRTWQH